MAIKLNLSQGCDSSVYIKPQAPECEGPRIAFIGDFPYTKEESKPLCSSHRGFLFYRCSELGINLNRCFIANALDFAPEKEDFTKYKSTFQIDTSRITVRESLDRLYKSLYDWKPDIVIMLGRETLKCLKGKSALLDKERGAPFTWSYGGNTVTALGTYHPKEVYKQYELLPWLKADIDKAYRYASNGWKATAFNIEATPSFDRVMAFLQELLEKKPLVACDIETNYGKVITCLGFSDSKTHALVIPFVKNEAPYWPRELELKIWPLLAKVLETCPLIGHNAVHFDHLHLLQNYGINANFVEDTMLAQWERCPEGPKSLAFVNSLYGDTPYWKDELGKSRSREDAISEFIYNGKDCCATYNALEHLSKVRETFHYRFNISTSRVFQHMSLVGARLDLEGRDELLKKLKSDACEMQENFSKLSGKQHVDLFSSKKQKGFNVRSPKAMNTWLYDELKLPPSLKKVKNDFGEEEDHETSDYLTILHLAHDYPQYPALKVAGDLRKLLVEISHLSGITTRPDGIVTWGFNIVGTDTTRVSGYKPIDGCGIQPQNIDRRHKNLFYPALPDCDWYKADLEGADSWTVAAVISSLGDSTLMDDLLAGLKPAQRAALALINGDSFMTKPVQELLPLKPVLKTPEGEGIYFIGKKCSHGTNYYMQPHTMSDSIFKESDGEIYYSDEDCKKVRDLLVNFYHLDLFHDYMKFKCQKDQTLGTDFGFTRVFLGRADNSLAKSMMSFVPQANTTFTTNTVANRLFFSEENRLPNGKCLISMCNMVHDELDYIAPTAMREEVSKLFYKNNEVPLSFNGIKFTIPFDAEFGPTWGKAKTPMVKTI